MRNFGCQAAKLVRTARSPKPTQQCSRRIQDRMTYSSLDRGSFQRVLANAFAVQESQSDIQSLSGINEVQRLIGKGALDVDGAIRSIADCARNVANATGVAIGLLKGDQLVYQAGSGGATTYIGRRVMATLTVPADILPSREILRVENAQTDPRIEAAICRQFGAKSLLILLIYHNGAAAGVLEVFFSEAHAFQDREVRTYQLMAGLIAEAMSHAAQLEERKNLTAAVPPTPRVIEQTQSESFSTTVDPRRAQQTSMRSAGIAEPPMAVAMDAVSKNPASLATMIMQRAKEVIWHKRRWNVASAAVATVLVLTCWIAYRGHRSASPLGSSDLPRSTAIEPERPVQHMKTIPAITTFKVQPAPVPLKEARPGRVTLQRVRVGKNEVDYFGDDVTVRYFTPRLASRRVRVGKSKVVYIGDDVTVHHFTSR